MRTFHALLSERYWDASPIHGTEQGLTEEEATGLRSYLLFFCKMQALRRDGLLDLVGMDRMFGYRFFIAMHDRHVQRILRAEAGYLEQLYPLYNEWLTFRKKEGTIIPKGFLHI